MIKPLLFTYLGMVIVVIVMDFRHLKQAAVINRWISYGLILTGIGIWFYVTHLSKTFLWRYGSVMSSSDYCLYPRWVQKDSESSLHDGKEVGYESKCDLSTDRAAYTAAQYFRYVNTAPCSGYLLRGTTCIPFISACGCSDDCIDVDDKPGTAEVSESGSI